MNDYVQTVQDQTLTMTMPYDAGISHAICLSLRRESAGTGLCISPDVVPLHRWQSMWRISWRPLLPFSALRGGSSTLKILS